MRRVFFFIRGKNYGSEVMRGFEIAQQLRRENIDANVLDLYCNHEEAEKIKDAIFIFVKRAILKSSDLIHILKKNKNIVIWDIVDCVIDQYGSILDCFKQEKLITEILDGVIYPNNKSKGDWHRYFKNNCLREVIYHHWDPRLKTNRAKNYRLVYAGYPKNIDKQYLRDIRELHILKYVNKMGWKNFAREILNYNCHFSVRKEGSDDFNYKSNVKLSTASATNSNIILTQDNSFTELLDNSYPYYTHSDMKNVKETIKYAKETYRTRTWLKALAMMQEVRERTSIKRICEDYIRFLTCF